MAQRRALLNEIYAPLKKFEEGSKEWYELFNSGKVWRDYYCPFEWRAKDYEYQEKNIHYLKEIDLLSTKSPIVKILQNMIVNFSHKSCAIEANTLELSESQEIWDRLNKSYNLNNLLKNEKFPPPSSISSSDKSEKRLLRKNMQQAGKFRTFVVQSYGDPFTVYPYDVEVPALMEEFMKFHDKSKNIAIHPIMISCRLHASLAHIHPFYDGNGRVSRSIMAQYLICNGYLPAIFHQVKREDYINSLREIQRGKDASLLYDIVISDILSSYHAHNKL
ncbi:unnamed protein product [Rhizophagus irregularis]|uniref:Fic-domain-containing protein n=1 Tax=Rhizophagus irregularis TaxID=588596 RepID=A0A2N1NCT0_9GLOM|nr:Fic-domain-containing protein [Rhizophagus irregularis]CAB4377143.1 unnamed protein product [Rhizophagus irregularis]CAB5394298.1 unnamed protein product [Rhizophagus irregularis]